MNSPLQRMGEMHRSQTTRDDGAAVLSTRADPSQEAKGKKKSACKLVVGLVSSKETLEGKPSQA